MQINNYSKLDVESQIWTEHMATMGDRAARYRYRAGELRALAEDWDDIRAQAMILELAHDYERMAETVGKLRVISSDPARP